MVLGESPGGSLVGEELGSHPGCVLLSGQTTFFAGFEPFFSRLSGGRAVSRFVERWLFFWGCFTWEKVDFQQDQNMVQLDTDE